MEKFDYIIIGAGAAGLLLADAMASDPYFQDRSILLIEKSRKQNNDRTWCFWEQGEGVLDQLVSNSWEQIYFAGQNFEKSSPIAPYTYKMIRGADFYEEFLGRLRKHSNIRFIQDTVVKVTEQEEEVLVQTSQYVFKGAKLFSSLFDPGKATGQSRYPYLQQHFLGWFVKTADPVFEVSTATFMDFSIPQNGNTRFMYVLPFSPTEALVEYTLFSESLLPKHEYENAIKDYLQEKLKCQDFEIYDKEQGSIPMTCYDFSAGNTENVLHIGMAGGWAKPSTGFTFKNTMRKTKELVAYLKTGKPLTGFSKKNRFWYYDLLLLDILHRDNGKGHYIFETLFKNRSAAVILKFLEEETDRWEDLNIIMGCPKKEFATALLLRIL